MDINLDEDLVYKLDIILKKSMINREAFYNILRALNITQEKPAINLLNFVINSSQENLDTIADELVSLRTFE
jgi:hypothetical protein